jgi:hypothetical protein
MNANKIYYDKMFSFVKWKRKEKSTKRIIDHKNEEKIQKKIKNCEEVKRNKW